MDRMIGGRYRVLGDLVGFGGFGRVWRARDELLHVDVAIKEVTLPESATPEQHAERVARAEREGRNAARLRDHPNIVAVHDVVVEDGLPLLIMRFVDGISLAERLRRNGPLSVDTVAELAAGMLSALEHAHAADIVHRDVKPANIMLAGDGRALLTDFGIAVHSTDTTLTGTGGFIGSLEYMAPERFDGAAGPASDLYSLGVTLYEAVEGVSPFRRDSTTGTFSAVLRGDAPPPRQAGRLTRLITALMAPDAANRPDIETARTLLSDPPTEHITGPPGDTKTIEKKSSSAGVAVFWVVVAIAAIVYFSVKDKDNKASGDTGTTVTPTFDYTPPETDTETYTETELETETETETETASLSDLPDPCDAPSYDTLETFALGAPKPDSDDTSQSCIWYRTDDGTTRSYDILSLHYLIGDPDEVVDGDSIDFPGGDAVMQDDGDTCTVVWSTSFGKAVVIGTGSDTTATPGLCDVVQGWAVDLYPSVPG